MKSTVSRWPCLFAGVIMMLFAGIIYAWSILKAPLAANFGWDSAALGLNFTITMCFFCLGGILGGILIKRLSPRLTIMIAGVLVFIGFLISSNLNNNIALLYVSYGGLSGLGIGVAYNAVISTVTSWFPDKRGTASGALMMGFGASTLVLGSIAGSLLHSLGWRTTYLLLGITILAVLVIGSFFIKNPSPDIQLPAPKLKAAAEETADYTPGQMLRRSSFWKFYILIILLSSIGTCVISFAKDMSLKAGASEAVAILLVGVLSIFNGLGRIIVGFLYDVIGRRKTMLIVNAVCIAAPIVMLLSILFKSVLLSAVGLVVVGLAYGSMPPISSAYTSSFYGKKNFALNFSIANTTLIAASFSSTIGGAMVKSSGSYLTTFIMLLCFAAAGLVINLTIKKA